MPSVHTFLPKSARYDCASVGQEHGVAEFSSMETLDRRLRGLACGSSGPINLEGLIFILVGIQSEKMVSSRSPW